MFEHSSFVPRRYGEDAVRRNNRLRGLEFIGTPEFERLFEEIVRGIDIEKIVKSIERPKVSIHIDDEETDQELKDNFKWKVEDDTEEEEPYIHEPDVVYAEDNEDDEDGLDEGDAYDEPYDKEPVKQPPSIFELLSGGKKFSDIVPTQSKHTEIYKQAFGLDDNGDPIPLPDDEDDEEDDEVKDLSVFIANRLTFLIQTIQPVIFDTSSIEVKDNTMTVAINGEKTFPKITSIDELGFITCKVNCSPTIQRAIDDFLGDDCFYSSIYCFPTKTVDRHGKDVFAIKFVCYRK